MIDPIDADLVNHMRIYLDYNITLCQFNEWFVNEVLADVLDKPYVAGSHKIVHEADFFLHGYGSGTLTEEELRSELRKILDELRAALLLA